MLAMPKALSPVTVIYKDDARTAELERMIGQLTMENALLKKPCRGSKRKSSHSAAMEADHD